MPLEPPLQTDTKADRGFHHPVLAKMLCPGSKQVRLVEDPEYVFFTFGCRLLMIAIRYIKGLKLGNVSDEDFPAFCYESSVCDPHNLEQGLFKGTFLQRVRSTISSEH